MDFIKHEDFKDPTTGKIDWDRYNAAQVANGEKCCECGRSAITFGVGHPVRCSHCEDIERPEELRHESRIRCPRCRHTWNPSDWEDHELYGDGEHEVSCGQCDHEFEISTFVSHMFRSPEMESGHKRAER